jgi:hypothetical protein
MTDLVLRIEQRIKMFEHSGIGNRTVVTLLRDAAQEISFLRVIERCRQVARSQV